jgi:hypothetical protein
VGGPSGHLSVRFHGGALRYVACSLPSLDAVFDRAKEEPMNWRRAAALKALAPSAAALALGILLGPTTPRRRAVARSRPASPWTAGGTPTAISTSSVRTGNAGTGRLASRSEEPACRVRRALPAPREAVGRLRRRRDQGRPHRVRPPDRGHAGLPERPVVRRVHREVAPQQVTGEFEMQHVPPGRYDLHLIGTNYRRQMNVTVAADQIPDVGTQNVSYLGGDQGRARRGSAAGNAALPRSRGTVLRAFGPAPRRARAARP